MTTKAEAAYLSRVTALGCLVCRDEFGVVTPAEVHHLRKGTGAGRKEAHDKAIPLCPVHHRLGNLGVAYHAGPETWERKFGSQESMVERTQREAGYVAKEEA